MLAMVPGSLRRVAVRSTSHCLSNDLNRNDTFRVRVEGHAERVGFDFGHIGRSLS